MPNPKILIVDDEAQQLESVIEIMEGAGCNYEVLSARNGKIAFDIALKEIPDLIVTDWEMPEMNGIEFIQKLKNNSETVDIPVIMCTGIMISSENLETALKAGAVDYVRKPVDKIELIARTKANLHLAEKYREIKKLNEMKDKIFSVISHDLRGPVGTIKSFSELVLEDKDSSTEDYIKSIEIIRRQSGSVFNTLENLLSWAQSQRNAVSFNPRKQSISKAIVDNLQLLDEIALKKKIQIENHIDKNHHAEFDLNLISIVVRNLLSNAIKFTPENGTITIDLKEDESCHIISIADSGVGMDPDRIKKIFDETSYETTYGTQAEKGSGLGLKLCKDFIAMHKGDIWVESEVGKGSTFFFTIPKVLAETK